jgi:hypothetical protein
VVVVVDDVVVVVELVEVVVDIDKDVVVVELVVTDVVGGRVDAGRTTGLVRGLAPPQSLTIAAGVHCRLSRVNGPV